MVITTTEDITLEKTSIGELSDTIWSLRGWVVTVINGFVNHLCDKQKGASCAEELASFKAAIEYKQLWRERRAV
jgi:hypothetical protein